MKNNYDPNKDCFSLLCDIITDGEKIHQNRIDSANCLDLLLLAKQHKVVPQLLLGLNSRPSLTLPTEFKEISTKIITENKPYTQFQVLELKILESLLSKNKIDFILLKGLGLSKILYDSIYARHSKDIDVLISSDQRNLVVNTLLSAGYQIELPDKLSVMEEILLDRAQNQFIAFHPMRNICVEIHWQLTTNPHVLRINFSDLWRKRDSTVIGDTAVSILPHEYNLCYLCTHFSRTATLRLKWISDIDIFVRKFNPDFDQLYATAKDNSCELAVLSTLLICNSLLKTPIQLRPNPKVRSRLNTICSKTLLKNITSYPRLAYIRPLLVSENRKSFLQDLKLFFGPRTQEARGSILNKRFYLLLYPKRWWNTSTSLVTNFYLRATRTAKWNSNEKP